MTTIRKSLRAAPDYIHNERYSKILARQIQSYWKHEGYPNVRVWVEKDSYDGETFDRPKYYVRSNIVFSVPEFD